MGTGFIKEESQLIREVLKTKIPNMWDGRKSILELKEANFNWRPMEWVGWFF